MVVLNCVIKAWRQVSLQQDFGCTALPQRVTGQGGCADKSASSMDCHGGSGQDVRSLVLVLTTRCQLRCPYCSQGGMTVREDMTPEILQKALRLVDRGKSPLHIQLTGGEPGLVPGLVELAVAKAEKLQRPVNIAIQSNGVQLDAAMLRFWKAQGLQVGISLDGTPRVQEVLRGRAGDTLRSLLLLEKEGLPFRITTVLSNVNVQELDRLVWLLAGFEQARGLGLDILVRHGWGAMNRQVSPPDAKRLSQGLERLLQALVAVNRQRMIPLRLRELDLVHRCLQQQDKQGRTRTFCLAAGGESLAIAPDGRLFPCGQVIGDARFVAGTVDAPRPMPPFLARSLAAARGDCSACPLHMYCPGDCPGRLMHNSSNEVVLACTLYQVLARSLLKTTIDGFYGGHGVFATTAA